MQAHSTSEAACLKLGGWKWFYSKHDKDSSPSPRRNTAPPSRCVPLWPTPETLDNPATRQAETMTGQPRAEAAFGNYTEYKQIKFGKTLPPFIQLLTSWTCFLTFLRLDSASVLR
jgi:hypothetical protein